MYIPKIINPIEPVFPIKLTALSGFPAINNPQPTTAIIPPGIKGHHTNCFVNVLEAIVINPQPKAIPTSNIPVCSKALLAFESSQAKYKPGAVPNSKAPGMINPINFQYTPAISKQTPTPTPMNRKKSRKFISFNMNGKPTEHKTKNGNNNQIIDLCLKINRIKNKHPHANPE